MALSYCFVMQASFFLAFMLLKNDKCFIMMSNLCYSNSGQVRKTLSIKAHADGTGYLISLSKNSILN